MIDVLRMIKQELEYITIELKTRNMLSRNIYTVLTEILELFKERYNGEK